LTGVDATKLNLSHPALSVKERPWQAPHRRAYYQLKGLSPPIDFKVHNSSIVNLVRGFTTRVLLYKGVQPVQPLQGLYGRRLATFRRLLLRGFRSTTPMSRQDFVGYYRGRKATIYQQAVDSLLIRGITETDSHIKAFVKAEFINFTAKPDPDPRIIQPRDPRYNVEVGRYLRPIEERIYAQIAAVFGEKTVFKGFNSGQMGREFRRKWDSYRSPCAIGLDASRFDQHVSVDALKWEHSVYNAIYDSAELRKLLRWQLENTGRAVARDGSLNYKVSGCRMSGDMNTALGNCLLMCALVHSYAQMKRVKISLANNGDDCVVIMEKRDADWFQRGLSDWFVEMGFQMKVEPRVDDFERIEFCQTHPIFDGSEWLMVRNFPQSLAKDVLSLVPISHPYPFQQWVSAVGLGGLSLTGGIPIYQSFYLSYLRGALKMGNVRRRKRKEANDPFELKGGLAWLSRGMERKVSTISQEARYSFYLAFGVTPDHQEELERYYDSIDVTFNLDVEGRHSFLPSWFKGW